MASLEKLLKSLQKEVNKKQYKLRLAKEIRDIIYKRTKARKIVSSDTSEPEKVSYKKNPSLSNLYVDQRGRIASSKGEFFGKSRSNLTLSGQMLDAMKFKVSRNSIEVFIDDSSRKPITFKRKRRVSGKSKTYDVDTDLSNKDVAEIVAEARPFMNLTKGEVRIITQLFDDILQSLINKNDK